MLWCDCYLKVAIRDQFWWLVFEIIIIKCISAVSSFSLTNGIGIVLKHLLQPLCTEPTLIIDLWINASDVRRVLHIGELSFNSLGSSGCPSAAIIIIAVRKLSCRKHCSLVNYYIYLFIAGVTSYYLYLYGKSGWSIEVWGTLHEALLSFFASLLLSSLLTLIAAMTIFGGRSARSTIGCRFY